MQVVFSLRDQEGHAIVRPAQEIEEGLKVFESGPGTNYEWEEIDYTETSFFVHTAENIDLEIVFVLDFTNSMAQARLSDGSSGIDAMLRAFEASLAVLPGAHRVGVVEFHDRNAAPSVISPLTTNRQETLSNVADFAASGFDSGSSRVWDALAVGADLFSSREQNPRAVRALVFFSDGRDTSSERTRERAAEYAEDRGAHLYAMGVGEVYQEVELSSTAYSTGGAYYSARDLNLIQEQLQLLVNDLRGQYQLTYITLRRTGEYRVGIGLDVAGILGETGGGTLRRRALLRRGQPRRRRVRPAGVRPRQPTRHRLHARVPCSEEHRPNALQSGDGQARSGGVGVRQRRRTAGRMGA